MKIAIFFFFSFFVGATVNLDSEVDKLVKHSEVPSLSIMILKDGKIIEHIAKGVRKNNESEKVTKDDFYHLGSCGKAFTSTLIFKLQEMGKLSIEDQLIKYITLDKEKFKDVKIKDLLSHTAGIIANVSGKDWADMYDESITASKGRKIAMKHLNESKRISSAGETYLYSNVGYMALGQIIESVLSTTYEKALEEKLLKPLGMNCAFGPVGRLNDLKGPWPHRVLDGKVIPVNPKEVNSDNPLALAPAGGISCSPRDWAKFVNVVMNIGESKNYISKKSREKILEINKESYTYGAWGRMTRDWAGGDLLSHAGSNTMNFSYAIVGVHMKFAFLVNTNSGSQKGLEIVSKMKDYYLQSLEK